tara:strand:+ start:1110 stop:2189 length:1080 start_codon:yes stop_codon:yes gene_type:complete
LKILKGKIINHNSSYNGEIIFEEKINSINKIDNVNFDNYIIPGFVDLHCHGGGGHDTMSGLSDIENMSKYHLKNGTTTILPTTLTATFDDTIKALKGLNKYIKKNKTNVIGVHLEGPFINSNKLGAQPPFTQLPDIKFINNIEKEALIKTITLAPELKGSENFIKLLLKKKIQVQIGHSLADYKCCKKIMHNNKIGFTHLYNAMSGNDNRNPGVLTAALRDAEYAEIICDLFHVNEENIHIAYKCIPKLYAISDSISATGMPDGKYSFAKLKINKKGKQAFIKKNVLAGSVINMHDTFKNLVKINFSLNQAVEMTSFNACQYLKEKFLGKIEKGCFSNLLVLDKKLNLKEVYFNGKLIK